MLLTTDRQSVTSNQRYARRKWDPAQRLLAIPPTLRRPALKTRETQRTIKTLREETDVPIPELIFSIYEHSYWDGQARDRSWHAAVCYQQLHHSAYEPYQQPAKPTHQHPYTHYNRYDLNLHNTVSDCYSINIFYSSRWICSWHYKKQNINT